MSAVDVKEAHESLETYVQLGNFFASHGLSLEGMSRMAGFTAVDTEELDVYRPDATAVFVALGRFLEAHGMTQQKMRELCRPSVVSPSSAYFGAELTYDQRFKMLQRELMDAFGAQRTEYLEKRIKRISCILAVANFWGLKQLTDYTRRDILDLRGMGGCTSCMLRRLSQAKTSPSALSACERVWLTC